VFFQFGSAYPLYLQDHFGLAKPQIGLMFAVNTVVIVFFEILVLDLIQRWPLVRTIGWGYFLACVGFGILPFGSTGGYAVLAMLLVTVGEMLAFSLSASFAASRSTAGDESRYMAWYVIVTSMAVVLGPAIGSAIYAVDRDALWIICLMAGVGVLVGFHLLSLWFRADVCEAPT
jgi:predicted MFS family arabinose efflux permease